MATITLKNASQVNIHGHRPGDVFTIEVDKAGIPTELLWRKRLKDEQNYNLGDIVRVSPAATTPIKKEDK